MQDWQKLVMRNSGRLLLFPGDFPGASTSTLVCTPFECHGNTTNEATPLQHFGDFHGKLNIIQQILRHGASEQGSSSSCCCCCSFAPPPPPVLVSTGEGGIVQGGISVSQILCEIHFSEQFVPCFSGFARVYVHCCTGKSCLTHSQPCRHATMFPTGGSPHPLRRRELLHHANPAGTRAPQHHTPPRTALTRWDRLGWVGGGRQTKTLRRNASAHSKKESPADTRMQH